MATKETTIDLDLPQASDLEVETACSIQGQRASRPVPTREHRRAAACRIAAVSDLVRRRSTGIAGTLVAVVLLLTLGSDPASGAFVMPEGGGKGDRTVARGGGDTTPPTKPTRLAIDFVTGSTVTISWKKSNDNRGVAGYDLYRDDQHVAGGTDLRHEYAGLSCGTSYRLGVEAYDAAGNRSERVTIVAATGACTDTSPPSEPRNVAQVGVTTASITLSWSASTDDFGVVEYEILRDGGHAVLGHLALVRHDVHDRHPSTRCGRKPLDARNSADDDGRVPGHCRAVGSGLARSGVSERDVRERELVRLQRQRRRSRLRRVSGRSGRRLDGLALLHRR